jgi:hypothetical protein
MPDATQPKPNPVPAIIVYGTPNSPALTQASWLAYPVNADTH